MFTQGSVESPFLHFNWLQIEPAGEDTLNNEIVTVEAAYWVNIGSDCCLLKRLGWFLEVKYQSSNAINLFISLNKRFPRWFVLTYSILA